VASLALMGCGLAWIAAGSSHHGSPAASRAAAVAPAHVAAPPARSTPRAPSTGPARKPAATASAPTVSATPAASTTPSTTADALEARGHALLMGGQAAAAVPVLRQAVASAPAGSTTYAYALFDLGRALRHSAAARAAAQVPYPRLQLPTPTGKVRAALTRPPEALGQHPPALRFYVRHIVATRTGRQTTGPCIIILTLVEHVVIRNAHPLRAISPLLQTNFIHKITNFPARVIRT